MSAAPDQRRIQLAHGGGGRAMQRLVEEHLLGRFANPALLARHDGAVLALDGPLAFTTDSYVVKPVEFPGGDIGTLAVNGTVNDLAMCGARPQYLSLGLILEEGLPFALLERILASIATAAGAAQVSIVTGDTKVVEHGKADGLFINTSGVGRIVSPLPVAPRAVCPGDSVILSGDIGRHGIAVLAARNNLDFKPRVASDCAPLADPVLALFAAGVRVHCLRDLTRGGLASALVEIAEAGGCHFQVEEARIPIAPAVAAACELLGLDTLHVANEGRFIAIVAPEDEQRTLDVLHQFSVSEAATVIGRCLAPGNGAANTAPVALVTRVGATRALDMLSGELLPRIC